MTEGPSSEREGEEQGKPVSEWRRYLYQLPGLWAGRAVPVYDIGLPEPGSIEGRSDAELEILIDVAKRQLDSQQAQLEEIRQRSQFLFATLLALFGLASASLRSIIGDENVVAFAIWAVSICALFLAILGTTAIIVNKKTMGVIDASWISQQEPPWLPAIAKDAMGGVKASWTTVANQLTYFRDAALLTLAGAAALFLSWGLSIA